MKYTAYCYANYYSRSRPEHMFKVTKMLVKREKKNKPIDYKRKKKYKLYILVFCCEDLKF